MIRKIGQFMVLDTARTSYCMGILPTGHVEHLYYGKKIRLETEGDFAGLQEKHVFPPGNTNAYSPEHSRYSLEDMRLEVSSYGRGDIREPFVEVVLPDGSTSLDFVYLKEDITKGKREIPGLPGSYGTEEEVEQLCLTLVDVRAQLTLELYYYVYPQKDVICRNARIVNGANSPVQLKRMMSLQLDLDPNPYAWTTFQGAWAREMKRTTQALKSGKAVNASFTGTSSNRANPFIILHQTDTRESAGDCYGLHLIYSGNHYEAAEVSSYGKLRLVAGINPQNFTWILESGEAFEAPEVVMTFSDRGFGEMSRRLHAFIRHHIVRGEWQFKDRPVLLNSWEAAYFDINEKKLLQLAKEGKEAGVELFVVDDGWFGERNDDTTSLGDWEPNPKKLPNGIKGLAEKIKALGLDFGIWVEPEMVNVKSHLYEAHPDWAIQIPGAAHSEGRNQRILDLTREEVQTFVIESMSRVFSAGDITYVKWDMNRIFTDYFSTALPPERQGEVGHRYVLGLYRCMRELTERFPHILFEGCASGGNRFDLGILCYFPQIWASDNTDALCRAEMQYNYSFGYPMSVVSAHVSACPNHQTLRNTPLETRFQTACFGIFGYECNLGELSGEEREAIRIQVQLYKDWRRVLQWGTFYRGKGFGGDTGGDSVLQDGPGNQISWTCVAEDQKNAVGYMLQKLTIPNTQMQIFTPAGLREDWRYGFSNREMRYNIKAFGNLVNTVSPIHIRQDSLLHNLASKFIKLDGETEQVSAYGDALMQGGIHLQPAFGGTGYNKEVRFYPDFGSRIYFMEAEK